MIAPILTPWGDEPMFIDGGDAMVPSYRIVPPEPLHGNLYRPYAGEVLFIDVPTVEVWGHLCYRSAIGFRGVVYGDKDRIGRLLNLAAGAILFIAWCCDRVTPSATPPASRS